MSKQLENIGEIVLKQVDSIGFQLDTLGVSSQINRHNLIASIFAGQKRFEGELDSVKARAEKTKADFDAKVEAAEKLVKSGLGIVAFPATYAFQRLKPTAQA